jgi:hypothetical protein
MCSTPVSGVITLHHKGKYEKTQNPTPTIYDCGTPLNHSTHKWHHDCRSYRAWNQ